MLAAGDLQGGGGAAGKTVCRDADQDTRLLHCVIHKWRQAHLPGRHQYGQYGPEVSLLADPAPEAVKPRCRSKATSCGRVKADNDDGQAGGRRNDDKDCEGQGDARGGAGRD
eukprot:3938566-Rhodomonas_salina.2